MKVSIVVPVFRNQGSILTTFKLVTKVFSESIYDHQLEFIFINDGSDDGSAEEIAAIQAEYNNVQAITFSRNFGQVPALIAGYQYAQGDVVCNISADLQDPPELMISMLEVINNGNHIAIGVRSNRDDGFINNATSKFFYGLMSKVLPSMPEGGFDYVMMDRQAVDVFNQINERNRFFQGDVLWMGFSVVFIPYVRKKRTVGKSQWSLGKKIKYFIDGLLNTSYIPIRLMSLIGLFTAFAGFVYALLIIYLRVFNATPFTGWAPIMVLILLLGGLIMLMLGIVGEYIWRIYDETRGRPVYIIKQNKRASEEIS